MSSLSKQHDHHDNGVRRDGQPRRRGSPHLSPKSLPQTPLTDIPTERLDSSQTNEELGCSPTIPIHSQDKGKQRKMSEEENLLDRFPQAAAQDPIIQTSQGSLQGQLARSKSVFTPARPKSPLTPESSKSRKHTSLQSPSSRLYDAQEPLGAKNVRPISSHSDDGGLSVRTRHKSSCSSNSRLKRILAERGMDDIDTSSAPSTVYSPAKSTGISMALSSASSEGAFPRRSMQETMHRLSLVLPPVPNDHEGSTNVTKRHTIANTRAPGPCIVGLEQNDAESVAKLRSWRATTYVPGHIKIDRTFGLYAIPIMTAMDVLCSSEAVNDEQVMDDMIDFFTTLGLEPMINTMDMFWKASDVPLPVSPPATRPISRYAHSPSKRASRHSPENSLSIVAPLLSPSPGQSSRSQNSDGSVPSPTHPKHGSRLSGGQQSSGPIERPASSRDSQHNSINARSSSRISPRWVMEHRDPNATAFLAVPSGTPAAVQQAILNKPTRPPNLRSTTHPEGLVQLASAQKSPVGSPISPDATGNSLRRRGSGAHGCTHHQQPGKARFSIRKMLSRSTADRSGQ